jgi:hypothetical protein
MNDMDNDRAMALDEMLAIVCEKLQLPPSLHDEAEKRYVAVGNWLCAPESELRQFLPDIYPQGSFRIGTTVRPRDRDEFDLDLVCEMDIDYRATSPEAVLNAVEKRLRENGTYARMIERKKRCVRLMYAKQFHLDILPAMLEMPEDGTRVQVPDRELRCWKPSNPKGYAEWFETRSGEYRRMLEKQQEPLPEHEKANDKTPLQKAVQLLKRARDIAFECDPDNAPRSIVLTTLAGRSYAGEPTTVGTFHVIAQRILNEAANANGRLRVHNPANEEELLSEKWEESPESYERFLRWMNRLAGRWSDLLTAEGIPAIRGIMAELFGEGLATSALEAHAERVQSARIGGSLSVRRKTGVLTSVAAGTGVAPVRSNTFYGEE